MELIQELQKIGLKDKTAKVFLANLELGEATLAAIARKAGVKRPTAYNVMAELLEEGLVAKVPRGRRTHYAAVSPDKLRNALAERGKVLERILPDLDALSRARSQQPVVKFYEGKEGLRAVYEEFFSTHRTIWSAVSLEQVASIFTEEENACFFDLLRQHGGRIMDLVRKNAAGEKYAQASYRKGLGRIKFFPDDIDLQIDILVVPDKVAFFSFSSTLAVVVYDAHIAVSHIALLKGLWGRI